MNNKSVSPRAVLWVCLSLILIRLVTLPYPDLVDTTEGRYAGVAQLMLERNDWVTPWINLRGVEKPYLGKPPLHFWLTQLSFMAFGQNNFAARFPGVLSALGIGVSLWIACSALLGAEAALISVAVLGSSCMLFFLGGAVVLDVTLTLGITVALVAFLTAERSRIAGYLFFAGLGLGVLVKGPLACVLAGCTIAPWVLFRRLTDKRWPTQLSKLPWVSGSLLFLAIVVPWYLWAEARNPGFLKYFLWNENFGRYLKSEYGDEYGTGHRQPFGIAWLMMIPATVPWSVALGALLLMKAKSFFCRSTIRTITHDSELLYGLCWTLSCPVLLLGAKQYTATYLMPSIPGFAFLLAAGWQRARSLGWVTDAQLSKLLGAIAMTLSLLGIIGAVISFWLSVPPLLAISVIVLSLLCGWMVVRARGSNPLSQAMRVTMITAFVYGAASFCFNNHLSSNRSSRRALEVVRTLVPAPAPVRLGLPFYVPFSASFYSRASGDRSLQLIPLDDEQIKSPQVDLLLVRKRNMNRLREGLPNIEELGSVGQWRIVRPIQAP